MKRLPLLITCTLLLTLGLNQVFAQASEVNLTVSPPVSYLHVAPGTSANHTIILENSGETPITVLPTIVDFTTDGKTGRAIVTNQLTFPYVSMGVDNSVKEVTIPPNKKAQLTLYISIPHEAQEKEYPLTVLFFSKSEQEKAQDSQQNSQKSNSQINAAIGSNLIVLVSKQNSFTKTLEVLNINAPKFVDSFQQIEFSPLVKNNSLGAVVASGSAKIVNWRKQTIVEFDVYPDTILGHNSREIRALLSKSDPQKPEVGSLAYKPKFLIGPYQIVLTLTGQDGTVIKQSVHVFYALPIAILAALLLGIALFYFLSKQKPKMSGL